MNTQSMPVTNSLSEQATATPNATDANTKSPDSDTIRRIEQSWRNRVKHQDYGKKSSITYRKAEIEFYIGAMSALDYAVPPWTVAIMVGRNPTPEV